MTHHAVIAETKRRGAEFLSYELFGAALLAVASLCIGLVVNSLRVHPLPLYYTSPKDRLSKIVTRMSAVSPGAGQQAPTPGKWQNIRLEEFQAWVATHKVTSIDVRPKTFYQAGHVPNAINLPREDFEEDYARVHKLIESEKEKPIVVYCSEVDCNDSEFIAAALGRLGSRHLFVYKEGWEEWVRAGLPQETSRVP